MTDVRLVTGGDPAYTRVRKLGKGGFGEVYLVRKISSNMVRMR